MVRVRISIGIVSALLLICSAAVWGIGAETGRLLTTLSRLEESVQAEDYTQAAETESYLSAEWEDARPWLRLAVSKTQIQEVSDAIARLAPLIETENEELAAELSALRSRLDELKSAEYPTIDRIF